MRSKVAAIVLVSVAFAGCGNTGGSSTGDATGDATGSSTGSSTGDAIEIEVEGDQITPNGERIPVKTGQVITLEVTSDRAGELHVHSTPDQEFEFDTGRATLEVTIGTPGIVDVEEHEADVVVLQLEVS